MSIWTWQEVDAGVSGASGDLAKLFRHEVIRQPGVMVVNSPGVDETLLAREVIQNSWDAARALRSESSDAPDFEIEFRFDRRSGASAKSMVEAVGLDELTDRAFRIGETNVGLADPGCLSDITETGSVDVLEIVESGTTGMYGPWKGRESKLYMAMVSVGFTNKATGAGGSYGYGKAGLIRGSAARTVVAYTCFRERDDDPGVSRRLLGMTYWSPHQLDGRDYSGFGRFGSSIDDSLVEPLVNDAADEAAARLGLELRDPDDPEQLGTTFLLVAPTVRPVELTSAIERNWWPALTDPTFGVTVVDYAGNALHPRPRRDPVLRSFIRAFEIATVPQDNLVATEKKTNFHKWSGDVGDYALGTVGLVADPNDWSYPELTVDGMEIKPRSLVALIRGPQMVVEYLEAGHGLPLVRGAFVADTDVDELLRQTEPKAHDCWDTETATDGVHPDATGSARMIIERIKRSVIDFRKTLQPPVPDRREAQLPDLESMFKQLFGDQSNPTRPHTQPRQTIDISILEQHPEIDPDNPNLIRLAARVAYRLPTDSKTSTAAAMVRLRYRFLEDNRSGARCRLHVDPPPGFEPSTDIDGGYRGLLTDEQAVFVVHSDPYDPDWSARLVASGDLEPAIDESYATN